MAGIEKICEFSGEYPGGLMYTYKRDHIQIMPKYRKLFRGADACIEIKEQRKVIIFGNGGYMDYDPEDELQDRFLQRKGNRLGTDTTFVLVVKNPELQGQVNGRYMNWTLDFKSTIKRLKRMLRCRDIKVLNKVNKTKG